LSKQSADTGEAMGAGQGRHYEFEGGGVNALEGGGGFKTEKTQTFEKVGSA